MTLLPTDRIATCGFCGKLIEWDPETFNETKLEYGYWRDVETQDIICFYNPLEDLHSPIEIFD